MAAAPSLAHLEAHLPPEERHPHSRTFEHHMKAGEGMRRLNAYITDTQPLPNDLAEYVFATQLVQSEALDCAYRIWRRGWGTQTNRNISGALVWQINDCWPVTSWSVIDSNGTPKPAYHTIKRALEAITVNLWPHADKTEIWAVNASLEPIAATLELRAVTLDGREVGSTQREVTLAANASSELGTWQPDTSEPVVIAARLQAGRSLARHVLFPEPWKHHMPHAPKLEIERDAGRLRLRSNVPIKALQLECNAPLESNNFDLVPGEDLIIGVHGTPSTVQARYLGGTSSIIVSKGVIGVGD
jgi:beta-mannosidase